MSQNGVRRIWQELRSIAAEMDDPMPHYREFPAWRTRSLQLLGELGPIGISAQQDFHAKTDELGLSAPSVADDTDVWEFESGVRDAVAILVAEAEAAERRAARVEANRPRVTPKELREAIAEAIAQHSANDVEGICDAVGMPPGRPGDDPMRSKRVYVGRRLTNVRGHELVAVARNLDADYGLPDVAGLAASYLSQIMTEDIPVAYRPNNHLSELPGWEAVGRSWKAATEKVVSDPEGAITAARTTLESVCKHICDERNVDYSSTAGDLSKLFKLAANAMEVAPDQHQDETIKQILRGIVTIVGGLASMRNGMSDSHGRGKSSPRPVPRHAKLAVSTALGVADFLIDTHVEKKLPPTP